MAEQHSTQVKRNRNPPCTCQHCGNEYINKRRGSEGKKYCGRVCAYAARKARSVERAQEEQRLSLIRNVLSKLKAIKRTKATEVESADRKLALAAVPCAVCGGPCGYLFGRSRTYCSDACHKASAGFIASRRIHKAMRRARKRQQGADRIDPIKVFERDGWRCHMCKKKLKPENRGTYKPTAPELDHIIALADGGSHTFGNVACSCRACNQAKSSKSFGQLGLQIAA